MRRLLLLAALAAGVLALPASAGAYVHQADCQNALFGRIPAIQGDNDIAALVAYWYGSANGHDFLGWGGFSRQSDNSVHQNAIIRNGSTTRISFGFTCQDGRPPNAINGTLSNYEDWFNGYNQQV